ncbi:hypothetical protein BH10ACI2_BH10ACI2_13430 [soil metagenome]
MKQCPTCLTTYTDSTLIYCLADGAVLTETGGEKTAVMSAAEATATRTRVSIPPTQTQMPQAYAQPAAASNSAMSSFLKIVVVLVVLGFLALIALGVGGFIFYRMNRAETPGNLANKGVQPVASPTPSKDDKDELREQIANLEKRISEQKKNNQASNIPLTMPNQPASTTSARVNSPGDGFLALRSLPSSEIGERIAKIPHGATIAVGGCGPVIKPGNKSGRWCQASYNGYSGWVFDAYLLY